MNWIEANNGRSIARVVFSDREGDDETAGSGFTLVLEHAFLGDHHEGWVVVRENGKERARYNVRHLARILWDEETS
jgi:hypothetical protein